MSDLLTTLDGRLQDTVVLTGPDAAPYLTDWTGEFRGEAMAVLRPALTADVSEILRACAARDVAVVPQGGNTGLVGGATPLTDGPAVVVQLGRMNRIRDIDPQDNSAIVEAGVVLANLQARATDRDRLFPLSLGSEGTAQIGGLIATNAGGTMALRWGMMRDLVLGLEVVLPDGQVWSDLSTLRKRNLGIDPKHLFIGAEGTTGIVTAAALRLVPKPHARATAILALSDVEAGPDLVSLALSETGGAVDACELVPKQGVCFAIEHVAGIRAPIDPIPDWSALVEISGPDQHRLDEMLMALLEAAMERDLVADGVIATSEAQRDSLWLLREAIVEGQRLAGPQLKHDIAVPIARIPEFVRTATAAVMRIDPDARVSAFGHLGDGNIHFNVSPTNAETRNAITRSVYETALQMKGALSAEHGLGRKKRQLAIEMGASREFAFSTLLGDQQCKLNPM